jgi:diguanylate cyclase (GGDEF)-like protein/PAS domain S-box-containing protein
VEIPTPAVVDGRTGDYTASDVPRLSAEADGLTDQVATDEATEESFEELYEEAPVAYFSTTPDDVITRVNGTLLAWTGYREDELIGRRFLDVLDAGTQLFYETRHIPVLRLAGEVREVALRVVRADGSVLPVLLNSVMVPGPDGVPRSIRTAMFDATDRSQYERDLLTERRAAESAALRVQILQNASSAFSASATELDLAETLAEIVRSAVAAGQACVAMLDQSGALQVIAGVNPLEGMIAPSDGRAGPDAIDLNLPIVINATDVDSPYPHVVAALGTARLASVTIFPLARDGQPMGVVAAFFGRERSLEQDAVDLVASICRQAGQSLVRIRLQEQLAHLALHDQLTGLPNRALLREEVDRSLASAARAGLPLTLMYLDLDGFKPVNDKLGHTQGDDVLREVARRLSADVREGDLVGRLGGDEFVVVCQETGRTQAEGIAERVREALQQPYPELPPTLAVSASVGVVVFHPTPQSEIDADDLLALADDEMYAAKNAGRNRVSLSEVSDIPKR